MEFEIDTADLEQIQDCLDHFPIIGVTTNPSILKKANTEDFFARMKSIRSLIGPARQLHAQVVSQSIDMQIKEAEVIHEKADPDIYIKVPVTWEGIRTISVLKQKEFHVTATAIYDSMQMYAAIEAGADYAAVYVNRICKMGGDPFKLIEDAAHIIERCHYSTKILAASDDQLRYLQTDLGSMSLFDAIRGGREAGGRYTLKEQELLKRTIRELPNMQMNGARGLDFSNCYPQAEFDVDSVLFDLNYFKYCFLKATEIDFHELKLEADFRLLAKDLTAEQGDTFLYRDFQARNVMLDHDGNPWFIDYQGGRKGPYYYDLASFLWQASAKYPHKLRRELVYEYYNSLKDFIEVPTVRHFVSRLSLFVLFRTLQVLGAYGFRGYFEQKKHFIDSSTIRT